MSSLLSVGFFNKGETRADLKCVGKYPLESDKVTIDTIGVTNTSIHDSRPVDYRWHIMMMNTSIQSFTKPVGNGCKSDDLHGADRTR